MSKLYIIPTPIGNLEDITLRALRLLKEVDLVLAEDTRTSKKLFSHYDIQTPLASFHMHNEHKVLAKYIDRIKSGETVTKGDLLQSNGDGTAKIQSDDNVKSSSFAKVLSNTKIETYDDGSFIVPCSLNC